LLSGILQGGEPSKKAKGKREYRRSKAKALELEEGMVDGEIGTKKPKEEARKVEEKPTAPKVAPSDGQEPKK